MEEAEWVGIRGKEVQGPLLRFSGSIRTCGMGFLESMAVGSFCHGLMGDTAYLYKPWGLSDEPLQMNAVRIKAQAGQGRVGQGKAGQGRAGVDPLALGVSKKFILFSAQWFEEFLPFSNEK